MMANAVSFIAKTLLLVKTLANLLDVILNFRHHFPISPVLFVDLLEHLLKTLQMYAAKPAHETSLAVSLIVNRVVFRVVVVVVAVVAVVAVAIEEVVMHLVIHSIFQLFIRVRLMKMMMVEIILMKWKNQMSLFLLKLRKWLRIRLVQQLVIIHHIEVINRDHIEKSIIMKKQLLS
jgi:hypothetical protein